jgi:hypothetical protein
LDKTNQLKMLKILTLLILAYVAFSIPVNCNQAVQALETEIETLITDPCAGRVCEEKCPCGKSVYFNLENILFSNYGASQTYHYVCTLASQAMFDANGKAITSNPDGDFGEIYQMLKKSLASCGYTNFAPIQGFDRIYHENEVKKYQPSVGYSYNRRVSYPPNILVTFAYKLKAFSKVCKQKSDWKTTFISSLNQKLQETKNENSIDYTSYCIYSQGEVMKNSFAKLILEPTATKHIEYCSCKKLMGKTTSSYNPTTHQVVVSYPFKYYESDFIKQCNKICSQNSSLTLEFE